MARIGRLEEQPNGDRFLVLEDGRRYERKPGTLEYRVIEFEKLGRRIEPAEARALPTSRRSIPTETLFTADGRLERSELFWRISVPVLALMLTLLAIPLGQVNPRMGRSFNLLAAAFLYMIYTNGLNVVQSLIAQGKLDFWVGLLVPHAIAATHRLRAVPPPHGPTRRLVPARRPRDHRARPPMRTLTRYIGRDVLGATLVVFAALLMLFSFFDLINELGDVGVGNYTIVGAVTYVALHLPARAYELFPVSALIGTLFALSQFVVELRIHRDARLGRIALAGGLGGDPRRHPARDRHVPRRRVRLAGRGAARQHAARLGQGGLEQRGRAAVRLGVLVPAGHDLRQRALGARRPVALRRAHLRVRPGLPARCGAQSPNPGDSCNPGAGSSRTCRRRRWPATPRR